MTRKLYLFEPGAEGRSWAKGYIELDDDRVTTSAIPASHLATWRLALLAATAELDRLEKLAPVKPVSAGGAVEL